MKPVSDPTILQQLNQELAGLKPVSDPALLDQLEGKSVQGGGLKGFVNDVKAFFSPPKSVLEGLPPDPSTFDFRSASQLRRQLSDQAERQQQFGTIGPIVGPQVSAGSVAKGLLTDVVAGGKGARAGVNQMVGDLIGSEYLQQKARKERGQADLMSAVNTPEIESATGRGIYGGLSSIARNAPSLALAAATRNPAIALGGMAAPMLPEEYGKFRQRGGTPLESLAGAAGNTATEVATEMLPMGFLVKQFGRAGAGQFLAGLLAREIPTEQVATLVQDAIDTAVANPDKTWGDYIKERPGAAYQALIATLTQGGVMGAGNAAANALSREGNGLGPIDQFMAGRKLASAINQDSQALADAPPPSTVQQTVARIMGQPLQTPAPQPQAAPEPLALGFDSAVRNPQPTMVADPTGNVRPMSADEQLAQQELADRMASIGLTPDVQRAIEMRQQAPEPGPVAPSPSDLIQRLMGTGWQPTAISSQGVNPTPDPGLVNAIGQDLEQKFQQDLKDAIRERLASQPKTETRPQPAPAQAPAITAQTADVSLTNEGKTPAGPQRLGVDNVPMADGGKPFKTKLAAQKAKKLQPTMRVVRVEGGFALADKTPAQLAAEAKAAKRIRGASTGNTGAPMSVHEFIAAEGGLSRSVQSDLGIEGNVKIGNRWLYSGPGKGMTIEQAAEKLKEAGYIDDELHNTAYDIIRRSINDPQYTPEGWEQVAESEREAQFEDYLAAQQEAAQADDFDPFDPLTDAGFIENDSDGTGFWDADPALQAEVSALSAQLDALGIDPYDILEPIIRANAEATQDQYNELAKQAITEAIAQATQPAGNRDTGQNDGEQSQARGQTEAQPEEGLTSYTQQEIEDRLAKLEQAEQERQQQEREAEQRAQADAERDDFTLTGSNRPADVAAARGQQDIFSAPAEDTQEDTQQDAPRTTGKIEDLGEKIGGARKDTATSTGRSAKPKTNDDRPAWARRFQISQIAAGDSEGRWVMRDTRSKDWMGQPKIVGGSRNTYATEQEALDAVPLAAVSMKHRAVPTGTKDENGEYTYEIWRDINDRKRVKVVDQVFPSRVAAMEYMAKNAQAILETSTTFGEADLPTPDRTDRTGVARREGDVDGKDFMGTFGFRGVEFGNWNNQIERQEVMNAAYDGLMDLAEVMAIPPKAIGLNGDLALAFGARGQGLNSARAHYESSRAVINLTKMNGAGALAHEWLHALDHYFGRQDGKTPAEWKINKDGTRSFDAQGGERDMASGGFKRVNSGVRQELRDAYKNVMETMFSKAEQYVEDTAKADKFVAKSREDVARALDSLRKDLSEQKDVRYYKRNNKPASAEQLAEFDTVAKQIMDGEALELGLVKVEGSRTATGSRWSNEALEKLSAIYKAVRGRTGFDSTNQSGIMDRLRGDMTRYSQRLKMLADAQAGDQKTKRVPTEFAMNAKELDQGRGEDYWTTPHEMAARAFQGYVEDKIAAQGARSPFLNYAPENVGILTPWGAKRPYPYGQERKAINEAFDQFVSVLQTRETDKGVMLYDITGLQKDGPISRLPEAPRANVLAKLKALEKRVTDGKISDVEYRAGVQSLIEQIEQRNETRLDRSIIKGRERGPDWITERLIRAKRKGELDADTVDFALWALAKNPALAEDLGISVREQPENQRGAAGDYNPASRVMRLFNDAAQESTAVHEILHHTERMMPTDVQNGILKAYQKAWDKAYEKGDEKTRESMRDMLLAQAGDTKAMQRVRDAFADGSLKYKDHYQLYNASEFWAVNATDILAKRYAVEGSWVGKAKRWLSEMLQYMKNALGLSSDAPVLRGLQAVLNGTGKRLSDAMLSGRDDVLQQMGAANQTGLQSAANTWTVPEPGTLDNAIRAIQNNKIDMKRVRDSIQERYGKVNEDADAYLNEELYHGKVAARVESIYQDRVEPILAKIAVAGKNAGVTMDDVNQYLHARHAPERNAAMKAINPDMKNNEALSGMSNQEAAKVMADFTAAGKDKALALIARDVDQLLTDTRTNLVADGLEDAGVVSAWESAYKHYVPLQRDIGSSGTPKGMGFSVRGPESKRAVGSNKEVVNILANIVAQAETAAIRAEKATVGRSLLAMARQYPNPDFWTVDKAPTKPRINKDTGLVERNAVDPLYQTADNVIMVKDYGQEHFIVFNQKNERAMAVAKAMKNLDIAPMNKILEVANKGTRFLASLLTQRNPLFWLTNFARDVQGAMLNLEGTEAEGLQRQVMDNLPKAFKGMHAIVRGQGTGQWARYAKKMQEAGGTTGYMQAFENSDARMKDLKTEVERMQQGKADPRRLARVALEFVDDYNDIIENAVRLSVFQAAREGGASTARAASIAKNITVNFNRKGNLTPPINALYMFFNASVQGTARLLQATATSKTARAAVGGIAVMGFMLDMLNRMAAGEDDETKRNRYDLIPEFEKSRNWIFMNPMRPGEYVKVPLPLGPHVFHNAGRLMSDAINRKDARNASEYGWSLAGIFLDAFSPLGQAASAGQLIAPSVLDPVLQVTENKSFTGAPVYKSADRFGKVDPKPAYTRYFESTPDVWKGASRMLNDVSGGDKDKPGMVNIEPDILKHVFYTLTGGPGRTLDQTIDMTQAGARGKELTVNRVPLASRFYGANDDQQRERAYYDDRKRAGDAKTQFDYYIKQGRMDLAKEVAKELGDGDEAKGRKRMLEFSRAEKSVRKINGEIRRQMERDDDGEAQAEQLKALRQRRVRVMSDALDDEE